MFGMTALQPYRRLWHDGLHIVFCTCICSDMKHVLSRYERNYTVHLSRVQSEATLALLHST